MARLGGFAGAIAKSVFLHLDDCKGSRSPWPKGKVLSNQAPLLTLPLHAGLAIPPVIGADDSLENKGREGWVFLLFSF